MFCAVVFSVAAQTRLGNPPSKAAVLRKSSGTPAGTGERLELYRGSRRAVGQLAQSFDDGDSYTTPTGKRHLRRLAGVLAVHPPESVDAGGWARYLTSSGAPLAGYTAREDSGGWVLFHAPDAERTQQLQDKTLLNKRIASLRSQSGALANPVFVDPDTGLRLVVTSGLVVQLNPAVSAALYFGPQWSNVRPVPGAEGQFVLTLSGHTAEQIFSEVDARMKDDRVLWVEPDLMLEVARDFTPNDPLYASQWHLNNTGQGGGTSDADVDAPEAWNTTRGSSNVVIAIIDDGVQLNHPDLAANIFTNTAELVNGSDDDGNGYVNDYRGWDFYAGDNNPGPTDFIDNHGTSCAGVAAAVGNNALGVTGIAGGCQILPVKVIEGEFFVSVTTMASAIRYAAGLTTPQHWRGADIISISLTFSQTAGIDSALNDAATNGRNGKGCLIFAATGNSASGYQYYGVGTSGFSAGVFDIEFEYYKDGATVAGSDCVWLGDVVFPDAASSWQRFTAATLPAGWATFGNAGWTVADDPAHAYGTSRYVLRSGALAGAQFSGVQTPTFTLVPGKPLLFDAWVSTEKGTSADASITYPPSVDNGDLLWVHLYSYTANDYVASTWIDSGVPGDRRWFPGELLATAPGYPASHASVIGVGACTDFGFRSDYSQYGAGLDLVTPSSGGSTTIYTTDRTGSDGYVSGDYENGFGGTSSASPLAAGIAALMLSKNPNQTISQVRSNLFRSCDKIGPVAYAGGQAGAGGTNAYYGYGRLNANLALANTPLLSSPTLGMTYNATNRTLQLSWNDPSFRLQSQTNNLTTGLGAQWHSHPGGTVSPVVVTNSLATPSVFYRLIWP
jgi:subtilisin family serine protease